MRVCACARVCEGRGSCPVPKPVAKFCQHHWPFPSRAHGALGRGLCLHLCQGVWWSVWAGRTEDHVDRCGARGHVLGPWSGLGARVDRIAGPGFVWAPASQPVPCGCRTCPAGDRLPLGGQHAQEARPLDTGSHRFNGCQVCGAHPSGSGPAAVTGVYVRGCDGRAE